MGQFGNNRSRLTLTIEEVNGPVKDLAKNPQRMPEREIFRNPVIMDKVFTYLPLKDLKNVSLVCRYHISVCL